MIGGGGGGGGRERNLASTEGPPRSAIANILQTDNPPAMEGGSITLVRPGGESGEEAIGADIEVCNTGVKVKGLGGEENTSDEKASKKAGRNVSASRGLRKVLK